MVHPILEIGPCIPHDLTANLAILMLLRVEVVEGRDAGDERIRVVAEHGHEAAIPKEDVLVKSRVDELGDEPALRGRFVKVVKRQLPGFPVEPHQHRVVIIDRRRQPGAQLCELGRGVASYAFLAKYIPVPSFAAPVSAEKRTPGCHAAIAIARITIRSPK
jgi:hypothetical protein